MTNAYRQLRDHFHRLGHFDHAIIFLQWDQLVMMPPTGGECRAKSIAELTTLRHEMLCTPQIGDLLTEAGNSATDPVQRRSLLEMERVRQRAICLPADLVKAKSLAGSRCEQGWGKQRQENDWPGFLRTFSEVVQLSREEAQARQSYAGGIFATPYDALLDLYCTGDSSAFIRQIFVQLKKELPLLAAEISARHGSADADLKGDYAIEDQILLNRRLMQQLGFDFSAGRFDSSLHPFSTGDRGDQRITSRFRRTDFIEALLATAHETGHAGYEAGLPEEWHGLPVGRARNMCIHESQSLLFEKQLFLSQAFISFFMKTLHELLPGTDALTDAAIWDTCTRVKPGLIRVEADEVTYPLHIILRFEIESSLINGTLSAEDIPEVWDTKMREYLGLSTAADYRNGCMQDIHWTDGSFGYFPSYTMGALNAAQLFAAIRLQHPEWQEMLKEGNITFIRQWLHKHIWSKACSKDSQEIIAEATGNPTGVTCFLEHLRSRYLNRLE